jgi:hypothetical protein
MTDPSYLRPRSVLLQQMHDIMNGRVVYILGEELDLSPSSPFRYRTRAITPNKKIKTYEQDLDVLARS